MPGCFHIKSFDCSCKSSLTISKEGKGTIRVAIFRDNKKVGTYTIGPLKNHITLRDIKPGNYKSRVLSSSGVIPKPSTASKVVTKCGHSKIVHKTYPDKCKGPMVLDSWTSRDGSTHSLKKFKKLCYLAKSKHIRTWRIIEVGYCAVYDFGSVSDCGTLTGLPDEFTPPSHPYDGYLELQICCPSCPGPCGTTMLTEK